MSKSEKKNDNKSMFLYTALIFIVAVLLIIFSFAGQTNMQKNQPKIEENTEENQSLSGISERASVLSDENMKLIEENKQLKNDNGELAEYKKNNDLLLSANGYFYVENYITAREILEKIDYDELTDDQKILYNTIKNNVQ